MNLVVGLGNFGEKYKNNRHNVGFVFVDFFAKGLGLDLNFDKSLKLESLILKTSNLVLAKPLTFMNDSGRAVKRLVDFYDVDIDNFYLAYDDLDIALGDYKIVKGKPPKTHNGVWSVINDLGSSNFWHVRIGVENRSKERRILGEKYVLEDFLKEEREFVDDAISKASKELMERMSR